MNTWPMLLGLTMQLLRTPPTIAEVEPYTCYQDKTLTAVYLQDDVPTPLRKAALALINLPIGETIVPRQISATIERIMALQQFSQVRAECEPNPQGFALRFYVTVLPWLEGFHFHGCHRADCEALRDCLPAEQTRLWDDHDLEEWRAKLQKALVEQGFLDHQLQLRLQPGKQAYSQIGVIDLEEGPQSLVRHIDFSGDSGFSAYRLRQLLGTQPGKPLQTQRLQRDQIMLQRFYADAGYIHAHLTPPTWQSHNHAVDVQWHIDKGPQVAIGFSGNHALSTASLRESLNISGKLLPRGDMRLLSQRIMHWYHQAGYHQVKVSLKVLRQANRIVYHYKIIEGELYYIDDIVVHGVSSAEATALRRQLVDLLTIRCGPPSAFAPVLDPLHTQLMQLPFNPPNHRPPVVPIAHRYIASVYREAAALFTAQYNERGYLQAQVTWQVDNRHPIGAYQHARIVFTLQKNQPSLIQRLDVRSEQVDTDGLVLLVNQTLTKLTHKRFTTLVGATYEQNLLEDLRIALIQHFQSEGYWYVQISLQPQFQGTHVTLQLLVNTQERVHIDAVLVRGNRYTKEALIHRRLNLKKQQIFRPQDALSSQMAVADLDIFNNVQVQLRQSDNVAPQKDVVVDVAERTRAVFSLAPGLSTNKGPRLRLDYQQINLRGSAVNLHIGAEFNRQIFFFLFGPYAAELEERYRNYRGIEQFTKALERTIRFGISSPKFGLRNLDIQLRADLVDERVNAVMFGLSSQALLAGADLLITPRLKGSLDGSVNMSSLDCIVGENCNLSQELRRNQNQPITVGAFWLGKLAPLLVWDRRDSSINPRAGSFYSLRFTYGTGAAASSLDNPFTNFGFNKYEASSLFYVALPRRFGLAFALRGGVVQIRQDSVPIAERFFLGGRDSIRGFVESAMLPQDACYPDAAGGKSPYCNELYELPKFAGDAPISQGGNSFVLLKNELRLPLLNHLESAVFVDLGNLWVDVTRSGTLAIRMGVGTGVRYITPVGVLAIDIGINPMPRTVFMEPFWHLHFSIGAF